MTALFLQLLFSGCYIAYLGIRVLAECRPVIGQVAVRTHQHDFSIKTVGPAHRHEKDEVETGEYWLKTIINSTGMQPV
jgi:hypothetical protein